MTREEFKRRHADQWTRLEALLARIEAPRRRIASQPGPEWGSDADTAEFDQLYRAVCRHLALARVRSYGLDLVDYLNDLALRAHHHFYGNRRFHVGRIVAFVAGEFPALVRAKWRLVLLSGLLFSGPAAAVVGGMLASPDLVHSVMAPEAVHQIEEMYDPENRYRTHERAEASDTAMFGFYILNNVGIAFQTFAGGMLLGVGSIFFLIFNGAILGAVSTHLALAGYGATFFPFVVGHSAFELVAIVLAGAAGINVGWAVLAPGRRPRAAALRIAALDSVSMVLGAGGMLVLAAALEAYWSSSASIPDAVKYTCGAGLWILVAAYFGIAGRRYGS